MNDFPDEIDLDEIERNVMSELKDFQKATVCRIDELFTQHQNRILVSDEVGLGKTLIARGARMHMHNYWLRFRLVGCQTQKPAILYMRATANPAALQVR